MRKGFGVAAITHKNSGTNRKTTSVSPEDLKNIIPKLTTLNSAVFTHFWRIEIQTSQNRLNLNQTEVSKMSDGSCQCERCVSFPDKIAFVLDSCKTFEPLHLICFDIILTEHEIWTNLSGQSPHCKVFPWKSRLLEDESLKSFVWESF